MPITIGNGHTGTTGEIILNGGDFVSGYTADLIYVATGATLNIVAPKVNGAAGTGTVSLNLAASGNFNVAGTATISVPIASGFIGTAAGNEASRSAPARSSPWATRRWPPRRRVPWRPVR